MSNTTQATVTHATTEISLSKLVPSPANARRTGAGAGIEALAASIEAHGLLQSLAVHPVLAAKARPRASTKSSPAGAGWPRFGC